MLFWGFILALAGFLAALVIFLSNLSGIISGVDAFGFGGWVSRFFSLEFLNGKKIAFYIAILLFIIGVICFFVGRIRAKKTGEKDAKAEKGVKFFRDLKGEFKKITWPTFSSVLRNTGVTLALCVIMGLIICLIDLGLGALIDLLLTLG